MGEGEVLVPLTGEDMEAQRGRGLSDVITQPISAELGLEAGSAGAVVIPQIAPARDGLLTQ